MKETFKLASPDFHTTLNIFLSASHARFPSAGKTSCPQVHPAGTAVLHNAPDNHVHTDSQSHAQACLRFYNVHPAGVREWMSIASPIAVTAELLLGALAT